MHFACIQSFITFVSVLEGAMQGNKILEESDGFLTAASFIACLSTISYNQHYLLLSYLTCTAYSWIRTYFTLGMSDLPRYFKFNISVVIVLILIYVFSRRVNQTQRVNFIQMKNQSLLINVFSDMIGSFHDGLMITSSEEIVYHNNKLNSIFEVEKGLTRK